jgi:hypothetical protein
MKVSTLIEALQGIDPDADVKLVAKHNPATLSEPDVGSGAPIYIAVTTINDTDRLVVLCNFVDDKQSKPVFDAPPQFKRFRTSTVEGTPAAVADLSEQANCEPTKDLETHLEVERLKRSFRQLKDLLQPQETNSETDD